MEAVPQIPPASQPKRKPIFIGVFVTIIILTSLLAGWIDAGSISSAGISDRPLSVYEVWQWAEELGGQVIRVRGKANFITWMTALLCCPPSCDCNETEGMLWLVSENPTRVNIDCATVDFIDIDTPDCQGNECSLTCTPFYPGEIEAFEFTGTLRIDYLRGHPCYLQLINVDLPASQQLVNGVWGPIPTGTFTVPLAQPIQDPSLCEDWGNSP